jgi:hypothetical protein
VLLQQLADEVPVILNSLSERQIYSENVMGSESANLLTPAEAAAIADVPVKAVYKAVAERLPGTSLIRRSGQTLLRPAALVSIRLDYELPRDVPVEVRRFVYRKVEEGRPARVEYGTKLFSYVVDPRPAAARIFAQAHPRRGRPRKPSWRRSKPLGSQLVTRRGA